MSAAAINAPVGSPAALFQERAETVLRLASRPNGVTRPEVAAALGVEDRRFKAVWHPIAAELGLKRWGGKNEWRYFATQEGLEAYGAAYAKAILARKQARAA